MRKKTGFTLTEMMIALAMLGILCATVIPAITRTMPNSYKIMAKRAYYLATNITRELTNDSVIYSPIDANTINAYVGLDNFETVNLNGIDYDGNTKYTDLFIRNLRVKGDIDTSSSNCSSLTSSAVCTAVYTTDGMKWVFSVPSGVTASSVKGNPKKIITTILVDTNGDKNPNCFQGKTSCSEKKRNFDQFKMDVYADGKVYISSSDTWIKSSVDANTEISGKD